MIAALAARHRGLLSLEHARDAPRAEAVDADRRRADPLGSLFILVFGLSLGGRIRHVDGVPYEVFIVPGLITMAMIQATYANNSASVFQARFDRYLNDVLAAPMRAWEINLALSSAASCARRSSAAACSLRRCRSSTSRSASRSCSSSRSRSGSSLFSSFGVIVGIYANAWDHTAFVTNIVILPLTFLGGVFYSRRRAAVAVARAQPPEPDLLPAERGALRLPRHERRERPAVARRHGGARRGVVAWSAWLFRTGHRLKP